MGRIFNGHKLQRKWAAELDAALRRGGVDVTHSGSRNVVGKFTLHIVQNPPKPKNQHPETSVNLTYYWIKKRELHFLGSGDMTAVWLLNKNV
jgi:hypothetical protein